MALPWLLGAAAVATVGYLASDNESSSYDENDDDYYERKRDAEKKERKKKRKEAKNNFYNKWEVKHKIDPIFAPKIQKLIKQEEALDKEIEELEALSSEIAIL